MKIERPAFNDIILAMRRAFSIEEDPQELTPDLLADWLLRNGVSLNWEHIPNWERYESGEFDYDDEMFLQLLFSPQKPNSGENVFIITDDCFSDRRGFIVNAHDLLDFARNHYPKVWHSPATFFQPLDMIFFAEKSKLLVLLHHSGVKAQYHAIRGKTRDTHQFLPDYQVDSRIIHSEHNRGVASQLNTKC